MMTLPRLLQIACSLLFVVLWFACAVVGQTETATVSGLVTDRTAAAVSGAEVRLQSVERGTVTSTTTNDAGIYVFPGVQPGQYQITIQKQGFKQVDLLGLVVNVQDHIEQNFRLEVGSIAESVTVEAAASMINTTDGSVSTVVDQSYIKNMPLNGRSFQDLILLTPGIVTQSPQNVNSSVGQTGEFSVNGQRQESNNYTVDGVSANVGAAPGLIMIQLAGASGSVPAATALGTTQALVSVDALQEFRVQSSTYSAEYGRNPGGQFAFETKAGTNQWHGTAYDYLRNGAFDAADWFNNYFGKTEPVLRQNDFGGTFGGPVEIPGLYRGKDKTFFFASYEGLRLTAPQAATVSFVPDATLRASAPAPLNQVLNAFPLPNGLDDAANGIAQYIASWSNPSSLDSTSVRFDHAINDKLRLFFRFSDAASSSTVRGTSASFLVPSQNRDSAYTLRTYTGGATSVFTNRLSNQIRANYTSNEATERTAIDAFGGSTPVDLAQLMGLGPTAFPSFRIQFGGYLIFLQQRQQSGSQKQWNLVDTMSYSLGRHQLKFGVDYRRLAPSATPFNPSVPVSYRSKAAISANNGRGATQVFAPAYPLYLNFSAFAQDEWKVSQRLGLSLGLRWDVNPAPGVTQGLMPYVIQGSDPNTWTLAPQGTPLWRTTWYNFAPRLGVAYILHNVSGWETVVRGGGGVFFDTGQQMGSYGFQGPGFTAQTSFQNFPIQAPPPAPAIVNPPVGPFSFSIFPASFYPHLQLPYTLQWNASIEQALGKSQALAVSYVGAHGARLLQEAEVYPSNNPNIPIVFSITNGSTSYGSTSYYSALETQFRRRLNRGLTALTSYTWSHCIDYGSQNYDFGYQRGSCDFDVRHSLSGAFTYDLPNVGHASFLNAIFHHWGLDDRLTARTSFPVTLLGNGLLQPNGDFYYGGLNFVSDQPVYLYGANCASVLQGLGKLAPGKGCPGDRAINPQAFANVSSGFGNVPRNFTRGFGAWQMDSAIRRDFPIGESLKLQFRAEAFNIFNHPNFGNINPSFGTSTFGLATGTLASSPGVLNSLYRTGGPRSMQFALRLAF